MPLKIHNSIFFANDDELMYCLELRQLDEREERLFHMSLIKAGKLFRKKSLSRAEYDEWTAIIINKETQLSYKRFHHPMFYFLPRQRQ